MAVLCVDVRNRLACNLEENFVNLRTSGGYEYLGAFERKSLITLANAILA